MRLTRKQQTRALAVWQALRETAPEWVTFREAALIAEDYGVRVPRWDNAARPLCDGLPLSRVAAEIARREVTA